MKLVKLSIRNYAGICQYEREFGEREIISGCNGEGKSSIFNAYKFSLGFNVNGFEPMFGFNNTRIGTSDKPCNTEVTAIIEKDGLQYKLKRVAIQTWKINKETQIAEYTGSPCKYYFDSESDCNASVYKEKVASLFGCSFSDLEIITDITYFNSDVTGKWLWSNRRKWLFDKLNIDSVVKGLADKYDLLRNDLLKGKDEVDLQKSLTAEKSSIKAEQERNLTLIEDKMKQLAVYQAIDFVALKTNLAELQKEYEKLLTANNKTNKGSVVAVLQDKLNELIKQFNSEKYNFHSQERELSNNKYTIQNKIDKAEQEIAMLRERAIIFKLGIEKYETEIKELETKSFDEHAKICKECGQQLQIEKIEALILNFERAKANVLADMRSKIEKATLDMQTATNTADILTEQLQGLQAQLKALNETVIDKSKVDSLEKEIVKLTSEISNLKMADVKETVSTRIDEIKSEMATINKELGKQAILEDIKSAIEMLKANSLNLTAKEQIRLKKYQQLTDYIQEKIKLVNENVNSYFDKRIEFNFFRYNTALADSPFENTCTVTMDGKNYSCLSYGEKAICDIRTMKGLQSILGVNIPIWVDNLESISYEIETEQQFIGLRVVNGKKLDGILRIDKFYTLADCVVKGN